MSYSLHFRNPMALLKTVCRCRLLWALLAALSGSGTSLPAASFYRPGDLVENFTLVNRSTRRPVELKEFEGKIVFLEWFAWWCPYCQASAPQVEAGIVEWYASRGGNPEAIPVMHVAVNLQPNQEAQTQNFVDRAGFEFVLEDFNRALANRFQSGGQPIFAIINGVSGSPSHRQWELLAHQDGYGQRDFSESLARFRSVIDAVKAPRVPRILGVRLDEMGRLAITIQDAGGPSPVLEASTDLRNWEPVVPLTPSSAPQEVRVPVGQGPVALFRVKNS